MSSLFYSEWRAIQNKTANSHAIETPTHFLVELKLALDPGCAERGLIVLWL